MGEYIGIDVYGREMYLSHACNRVYCQHVKKGKVVRTNSVEVSNDVIMMFGARHTSGAYIYDDLQKIPKETLRGYLYKKQKSLSSRTSSFLCK